MAGWNMSRGRSLATWFLALAFVAGIPAVRAGDELTGDGQDIVADAAAESAPLAIDERQPEAESPAESEPSPAESDAPTPVEEPPLATVTELDATPEPTAEPVESPAEPVVEAVPSHRIRMKLDVSGEIFAPAGRDMPPVRRSIAVDARFDFVQTGSAAAEHGVIRRYRDAAADVRVEESVRTARLPADARTLRAVLEGATPTPSLATGFLTREELDLLETPFDPLLLDRLLPEAAPPVGGSWTVPADAVAGLLAIDTVEAGTLDATLAEVGDGRAEVKFSGIIDGAADGVPTHVVVEGTYAVPAAAAGGMRLDAGITNLAVKIQERREASHVAPGFDVEARLTVARTATEERADVADAAAESAASGDRRRGAGRPGFVWQRGAAGRYDLVHDARWRVIEDGPDGLVMRLVDRGALVAQCSIIALPRAPALAAPTIAEVERDLQRSLAGQFGRLEHSSEATRSDGVRLVRVVVTGRADGLPFRWIHAVLTDDDGDRVAVTCTLEDALEKRFGTADRELVDGIQLPGDGESAGKTAEGHETTPDRQARLPQESRTP
jgi:hypothetical protein